MAHALSLCLSAAILLAAAGALAGQAGPVLEGQAAFGDWKADKPGLRRLIRPGDLPRPYATQSASNGIGEAVPMPEDARPLLPEGFSAELLASGIRNPRAIRIAPDGDLFVADSRANQVRIYRLGEDGRPVEKSVFADGLNRPYGIAFYPPGGSPRWVYVANTDSVVRYAYNSGDLKASGEPETVVDHIPSVHHWTRDIAFSPDGGTLYLSVGSGSNVAEGIGAEPKGGLDKWAKEQPPGAAWGSEAGRADVLAFDPDGNNRRTVATGLRNCAGMTVQPATGKLWCVVNERDGLGDDVPFEYATAVEQGAFYGWPWYYIGGNEDPRWQGARPDLKSGVTVPDVLMQAHSAPLGITFYEGGNFPAEYRGDAFVTLHGSWNRGNRTGYKVVRLLFKDGRPTGEYEDFMTGFVVSDDAVWGRPVGVAVAKDGALIVSEDGNGTIWRVTHDGRGTQD
jgi:glucose/arabinose dehydrogenase